MDNVFHRAVNSRRNLIPYFGVFAALLVVLGVMSWTEKSRELSFAEFHRDRIRQFSHKEKPLIADLDANGSDETLIVRDGRLNLASASGSSWMSPASWWIDQVRAAKLTAGKPSVVMSVWKEGSFGAARPFWVLENDHLVRQHLFVFQWDGTALQPVWQSSALPKPNCYINFTDANGDGRDELIASEGSYSDTPLCVAGNESVWDWNGFGFTKRAAEMPAS